VFAESNDPIIINGIHTIFNVPEVDTQSQELLSVVEHMTTGVRERSRSVIPHSGLIGPNRELDILIEYQTLDGYVFSPDIVAENVRINGIYPALGITGRVGNVRLTAHYIVRKSDLELRNLQPWTPPPHTYPGQEPPTTEPPTEPTEPREYDLEDIVTALEYQTEIQKIGIGLTVGSIIGLAFMVKWRPGTDD
jgi:hypothetical protein